MSNGAAVPDFRAYEDGKHRRYELLFAVNGGAFAIAKLLLQCKPTEGNLFVLGNLSLHHLAIGMVFFTVVMVFDIYSFGRKMRLQLPAVFGWEGKLVLLSIGCLIGVGWFLVG
jgi:hypothetical protein